MTENDRRLIARAEGMSWQDWDNIADMEDMADSDDARRKLHSMAVSGYHKEEAKAGMI